MFQSVLHLLPEGGELPLDYMVFLLLEFSFRFIFHKRFICPTCIQGGQSWATCLLHMVWKALSLRMFIIPIGVGSTVSNRLPRNIWLSYKARVCLSGCLKTTACWMFTGHQHLFKSIEQHLATAGVKMPSYIHRHFNRSAKC